MSLSFVNKVFLDGGDFAFFGSKIKSNMFFLANINFLIRGAFKRGEVNEINIKKSEQHVQKKSRKILFFLVSFREKISFMGKNLKKLYMVLLEE